MRPFVAHPAAQKPSPRPVRVLANKSDEVGFVTLPLARRRVSDVDERTCWSLVCRRLSTARIGTSGRGERTGA